MRCPFCGSYQNKVVDKREVKGTGEIRRRRECLKCQGRFTTYEQMANLQVMVMKRDGRKQVFDREKIKSGLAKALEKRPYLDKLDEIVERIEKRIRTRGLKEIPSTTIGKMVLNELKKLDKVAYLRFASVYRHFDNPSDFAKELQILNKS